MWDEQDLDTQEKVGFGDSDGVGAGLSYAPRCRLRQAADVTVG